MTLLNRRCVRSAIISAPLLCVASLCARSQTELPPPPPPSQAPQPPPAPKAGTAGKRPRVALVLEGGGALGFAHIGVIAYLEQHHIPVDLVVGTSMGGLVGGLYASGRSPDEITALVREVDWDQAIGGRTPFGDLSYRRKEDRTEYPNRLEFGLKHGLSLPEGLNSGQQVGLILDRATLADFDLQSFDDLPIPFRCVATNMNTGRPKVFSTGSLAPALRATMSIPGVFAPVVLDGVTYTDGGAVDNLPVDVAKANGADIVIASYLATGQSQAESSREGSFLSTAGKTISVMIAANELRSIEDADILLRSDVTGFTSSMFTESAKLIPRGEVAAGAKAGVLGNLSVGDAEWARYVAARDARRKTTVPQPQFLAVTGADPATSAEMTRQLAPVLHRPIDTARLDRDMTRFVGNGTLNAAGYSIIERGTERGTEPGLLVSAYPKTYAPPFLNLAINIDGSDTQDVLFGMAGRITLTNFGGYRAELRTDAFFGYSYGVRSEYYKPFTARSRFFFAPRGYATSTRFNFYNEGTKVSEYQILQNGGGLDLGYTTPRGAEFRVGQDEFWYSAKKRIDFDNLSFSPQRQDVTSLRFNYLGTDNGVLPLRGALLNFKVERHHQAVEDSFTLAEARVAAFIPLRKQGSGILRASGGTSFGAPPELTDLQGFPLGGPFRLGSYGRNELLGNQYWLLQGGYERRLLRFNPLIGEGVYGLILMEGGKVYANLNPVDELESEAFDGSFAIIARTALGPIYVGGAARATPPRKWWFGLGRVF